MKAKSMTASSQRAAVDRRLADHHRVGEAGLHLGLGEPLGVGAEVEEAERILRVEVGGLLDEASPRRRATRSAARARIGKWCPQCAQTQSACSSSSSR